MGALHFIISYQDKVSHLWPHLGIASATPELDHLNAGLILRGLLTGHLTIRHSFLQQGLHFRTRSDFGWFLVVWLRSQLLENQTLASQDHFKYKYIFLFIQNSLG